MPLIDILHACSYGLLNTWRLDIVPAAWARTQTSVELAAETFPGRSFRGRRLRFAHHVVHFAEQILFSVRLADEAAVIGNFSLSGLSAECFRSLRPRGLTRSKAGGAPQAGTFSRIAVAVRAQSVEDGCPLN
jgi:hypothetical protein